MIRASADAKEAREQLMARDWPAKDMATMVLLIDDPRHRLLQERSTRTGAAFTTNLFVIE